jgi:TatD DNase family protein
MTEFIDTHAHIQFPHFNEDRESVIQNAEEGRVSVINVGTSFETSLGAINLAKYKSDKNKECAELRSNFYTTIGIHPHVAEDLDFDSKKIQEEIIKVSALNDASIVAIGECGIDVFRTPEEQKAKALKEQDVLFRAQIEMAIQRDIPIMIHARESYSYILPILDEYLNSSNTLLKGNAHFFAGTKEEAAAFLDRGFTVSFTGVITFADVYRELVDFVPLEKMHAETDCPYVAPVPFRGKRNEPAFVIEVVKKIAQIKNLDIEVVKKTLYKNASNFYKLASF